MHDYRPESADVLLQVVPESTFSRADELPFYAQHRAFAVCVDCIAEGGALAWFENCHFTAPSCKDQPASTALDNDSGATFCLCALSVLTPTWEAWFPQLFLQSPLW